MKTLHFKFITVVVLLLTGCTKGSFNSTPTPTAGSSSSQSLNSSAVKVYSDSSFDNSQMAAGTYAVIPDNKIYNFGTLALSQGSSKALSIKLVRDPKNADSISMPGVSAFTMITQKTINNDIYFMIMPKATAVGNYSENVYLNIGGKKIPIILRVNITAAPVQASNCVFNTSTIRHGSLAAAYQSAIVPFGSTCVSENRVCNNGVLSGSYTNSSCSVAAAVGCTFNGSPVANGANVVAYESATVAFGATCKKETRSCTNGVLSGSFTSAACAPVAAASCAFDGKTYASGTSVLAYPVATVPFGTTCKAETRTCTNGVLSGVGTFANCSVATAASCVFDNKPVTSGSSVTAYETATVPFGSVCKRETRLCTNGVLSGTMMATNCAVADAASCTFDGKPVANSGTIQAYATATVPYGTQCKVETRTCNNGVLSGSNTFASCAVNPANGCTFDNKPVGNGTSVQAYATATVPYGTQCKVETRTCNNGDLSGSNAFASCAIDAAAACTFDNKPVANNASVIAYEAATVPFGQTCRTQSRTCTNGVLSGSYSAVSCAPAAAATCPFDGKQINNGGSVWAYVAATVPYGSPCSQQLRICSNGVLSGTYSASACVVSGPTADSVGVYYNKNFYDPTVDESVYAPVLESDTIDLGEVPLAETASQVLLIKLKNSNASALSVTSSGLNSAALEGFTGSVGANQELIIKLKPSKADVGSFADVWSLKMGTKAYTIKVKGRIVP